MTDTNNGWPGKPGVPLNPHEERFHWLKRRGDHTPRPVVWWPSKTAPFGGWWAGYAISDLEIALFDYLGPCLTPDEAAALQARVAELEDFCEDYLVRFELFHVTNTKEAPEDATGFLAEKARAILGAALEGKKDE